MISWLIGIVTGMMYDIIGIAARLKPEDEARGMKARWALSLESASFLVKRRKAWLAGFRASLPL
jgi:hypothetical protein